jgi:uncharacterized protein YycO
MIKYSLGKRLIMKKTLLIILYLFTFISCAQKAPINTFLHPSSNACTQIDSSSLDKSILDYQVLVEKCLVLRKNSINYIKDLNQSKPINGKDIDTLRRFTKKYSNLRKNFYEYINKYSCFMDKKQETTLPPKERLKAGMIALSAALILYDNYLLDISLYEKDERLRKIINSQDKGYNIDSSTLFEISESYSNENNRKKLTNAIKYYKREIKKIKDIKSDPHLEYLYQLIEQSPSYHKNKSLSSRFWFRLKVVRHKIKDEVKNLLYSGSNFFSKFFGNSVGLVETRKGKLYKNKKVLNYINRDLKAGDILLEKTPFRLTDSLIPGHWGHVAVYTGTEEELKELGIWNHPVIQKYHAQIKENRFVAEALRDGVQLNTLEHFLNIDDFSTLRYIDESKEEKRKRIILTFRQIGKEYDFNFDVETSDKIVCSELVYISTPTINWETPKTLGRYTISPDNIAVKSVGDQKKFSIVCLVHDGKIIKDKKNHYMERLLALSSQ